MVYSRSALALVLLLTACPDDAPPSSDSGSSTNATTPTNPTADGTEGPCPDGGSLCGSDCVFLGSDNNNCGACGVVCSGVGEECIGAMCVDTDPCDGGPGTPCGSECVDINNDDNNCGDCGRNCDDNEICTNGDCIPQGGTGETGPNPTTSDGSSSEGSSSGGGSSGGSSSTTM
ncbi:MAG: hypothetical protein KDK70_33495 [Myxococcales bacterium]|nr:hypothetical protein [Myxococcales bacterium]